jgi:hypothetical protein
MILINDRALPQDEERKLLNESYLKYKTLLDEIQNLRNNTITTTSSIWGFLLQTQFIEFQLQHLLVTIGLSPDIIERRKKIRNKNYEELTLGQLKNEITKYPDELLKELGLKLEGLNKIRIRIAHHMFIGLGSLDELIVESKRGQEIGDSVSEEIYKINLYLDENSSFGKLMNKPLQ